MTTDLNRSAEDAQRLAAIVESSDDAIVSKDLNGVIESWNKGAERLFGYTADEVIGKSILVLIPPDRQDEESFILQRIHRGERVDHLETLRRRKDGTLVPVSVTVSPIKNAAGTLVGASKIARDITEHVRLQEQQQILVNEMRHRMKNTLAIVLAIASQTFRQSPQEEKDAFMERLQALAQAQDLLNRENWKSAPVQEVVTRALAPFHGKHRDQIVVEGEGDFWLEAAKVSLLSMGLYELATNAAKYGALSNSTGRVHLRWTHARVEDCLQLRFEWKETGGPPTRPPTRRGFGMRLLQQALESDLGRVRIAFEPQGIICTLEISL
jgi:PAS domain S-box-containing protein